MKYAHMADCHLGGWADPKMRYLNNESFIRSMDKCIEENVDFILIAGDLFNSSIPAIDSLKIAVQKLREVKDKGIAVYIIPGSHDFSPTGKTMIDVLCEADLCLNVAPKDMQNNLKLKFTVDKKTGAKITGMLGKRGMLEKTYYEALDYKEIEQELGYKIFMFHTALTELKPKELDKMDSASISLLPKGFDYYAGGHVHIIKESKFEEYKQVVYPGPICPNNFKEMEDLGCGGFIIVENDETRYIPILIYETQRIGINCDDKSIESLKQEIIEEINNKELNEKIILIRIEGKLLSGNQSDIDFKEIFKIIYDKGAYLIMKNTFAIISPEMEEMEVNAKPSDEIELEIIKKHIGQIKIIGDAAKEEDLTKNLMKVLETEKQEGEKVYDFEARIIEEIDKVMGEIEVRK